MTFRTRLTRCSLAVLINVQPLFSNCRALAFWSRVLFLVTNPAYERFAREKPDQLDSMVLVFWRCFRFNFRSKSGQNSFKILDAMSTPSCMPSLDVASPAVRLFT